MNFLAGAMLWGALAAAIPVVIHLLGRAKPVAQRFPAMRFLARSHKVSSRALRLKHLLLLCLRMAALGMLAFTLARPVFPVPPGAANGSWSPSAT